MDVVDESKLYMAFLDGLWYRATLTEGPDDQFATACFVDYGETVTDIALSLTDPCS